MDVILDNPDLIQTIKHPAFPSAVERKLCESSLYEFMRAGWHVLEPGNPFQDAMHLRAMCAHLEAVSSGKIPKLIMNVCPGLAKSLCGLVFYCAWEWIHRPETRFLCVSYSDDFAMRDSMKMRALIGSEWYRHHWGSKFVVKDNQDTKQKFENSLSGFRHSTSIKGGGTGSRADILLLDDLLKIEEAYSETARNSVNAWYDQVGSMRGSNPLTSKQVNIHQRLHVDDLTGHLLRLGGWTHFFVPLEYDPENSCETPIWKDPRTLQGDSCWPERFTPEVIADRKKTLGFYGSNAQLQQRPQQFEGGIFKSSWFCNFAPVNEMPVQARRVRGWDLASTRKDKNKSACWTASVLLAADPQGRYYVQNVVRAQLDPHERDKLMLSTAIDDRARYGLVTTVVEHEGGSSGKDQALAIMKLLRGYECWCIHPTGPKEERIMAFASQLGGGNVWFPQNASWFVDFRDELLSFPKSEFMDQVDACSAAFNRLAQASWSTPAVGARPGAAGVGRFDEERKTPQSISNLRGGIQPGGFR